MIGTSKFVSIFNPQSVHDQTISRHVNLVKMTSLKPCLTCCYQAKLTTLQPNRTMNCHAIECFTIRMSSQSLRTLQALDSLMVCGGFWICIIMAPPPIWFISVIISLINKVLKEQSSINIMSSKCKVNAQ